MHARKTFSSFAGQLFAVKSMFVERHLDDVVILCDARIERIARARLHQAFSSDSDIANRRICQILEEERRLHNWVAVRAASFIVEVGGLEDRMRERALAAGYDSHLSEPLDPD